MANRTENNLLQAEVHFRDEYYKTFLHNWWFHKLKLDFHALFEMPNKFSNTTIELKLN